MKYLFALATICLVATGVSAQFSKELSAVFKPQPALQKPYLPDWFNGSYILQPLDELKKGRPSAKAEEEGFAQSNWNEHDTAQNVVITYQRDFDTGAVYEFIFEYAGKTHEEIKAMALAKYGKPNFAKEDFPAQWRITLKDGLTLQIWVFQNKLCIGDARKFFD